MSSGDWCLLESDPGLFSALIREFGSTGAQVDELWGLDPEVFKPLGKIFGLIFLFKWDGKKETQSQVSFQIMKLTLNDRLGKSCGQCRLSRNVLCSAGD